MKSPCQHLGKHKGNWTIGGVAHEHHVCKLPEIGHCFRDGAHPTIRVCEMCPQYVEGPPLVQLAVPKQTRATAESLPCSHRGAVTRSQESDLCGSRGQFFDVFACDLHTECAIGRVCQRQTVRACTGCADRAEPEREESQPGN